MKKIEPKPLENTPDLEDYCICEFCKGNISKLYCEKKIRSALDGAEAEIGREPIKPDKDNFMGLARARDIYRKWFRALYEKEGVD